MELPGKGNPFPRKLYIYRFPYGTISDLVGYEIFIALMEECDLFRLEGDFLEIGCFIGGGTAKLAKAALPWGKKVYAVDIFDPDVDRTVNTAGYAMADIYHLLLGGRNQEELFLENTREYPNIRVVKGDSRTLRFSEDQKFVFAFLDGNHEPEVVKHDFHAIWPHIVPGGIMAFHDYGGDLPQTTGAIDELLDEHREQIARKETIPPRWLMLVLKK
ncbi:MAG: class I SAM-dependent methyltransferase [Candidatus Eremiobacteraeota bacterium]|nr:class I SAM-dependent methyltransferase [Candidatus Eremiobacteraeota bacterium]